MNHKNLETIYFKMISSQVHYYILHVTRSCVNVVTIWINKLFLPFPVHSFFRASPVFLAGCCCRNTIDGASQPMHLDSNAQSEEPSIWLFIYPQPSFEDSPPRYKSWQSTSRPQSSFSLWWSLWSTPRSQLCLPYVSRVFRALKIPRAWPSDIYILFFFHRKWTKRNLSVFLKANSGREATVCICHWAKGINVAQTWAIV